MCIFFISSLQLILKFYSGLISFNLIFLITWQTHLANLHSKFLKISEFTYLKSFICSYVSWLTNIFIWQIKTSAWHTCCLPALWEMPFLWIVLGKLGAYPDPISIFQNKMKCLLFWGLINMSSFFKFSYTFPCG